MHLWRVAPHRTPMLDVSAVSVVSALEDRARALAMGAPSSAGDRGPSCGQDRCLCTHGDPCDRGWLDLPPNVVHTIPYARVAPCPVCRPGAATRYERDLARSSRAVR